MAPPSTSTASIRDALPPFERLVRVHLDFVWRLLRRLGLSPADADDAAQHVFWLAKGKLDQIASGKERAFLYSTAVRVAANARRARRNRREVPDAALPPFASSGPMPDELVELERARAFLDELLGQLPDELRRVLVLAEVEQWTLAEIAEIEGVPPGTAASRLRRARASFRELLSREQHRNPWGARSP